MAVTATTNAGIVSNADDRPANGSSTLVVTSNWADPQRNNVTVSTSGRTVRVYQRNANKYNPSSNN